MVAASETKMSSKKKKRLDGFINKKLKKEARAELFASLEYGPGFCMPETGTTSYSSGLVSSHHPEHLRTPSPNTCSPLSPPPPLSVPALSSPTRLKPPRRRTRTSGEHSLERTNVARRLTRRIRPTTRTRRTGRRATPATSFRDRHSTRMKRRKKSQGLG
jgi:hypothetical protein